MSYKQFLRFSVFLYYADNSNFVLSSKPWFERGGGYNNGVIAGQFKFERDTGVAAGHLGSRLVLAD